MLTIMHKNLLTVIVVCIFSLIIIQNKLHAQDIQKITIEPETFIDYEKGFKGEYLAKPQMIGFNKKTSTIFIVDMGNYCIYEFNKSGNLVNKFGGKGQGPGEFLSVFCFYVSDNGNIYLGDDRNRRITQYSQIGKYVNSFRIDRHIPDTYFSINDKEEIIFNYVLNDKYITVLTSSGEVKKEIGQINHYESKKSIPDFDYFNAFGWVFNKNDIFYAIIVEQFKIILFNEKGDKIKEIDFSDLLPPLYKDLKSVKILPEKKDKLNVFLLFQDVLFTGNKYYFFESYNIYDNNSTSKVISDKNIIRIYECDENLSRINKIITLKLAKEHIMSGFMKLKIAFDPEEECFYLPIPEQASVYKYNLKVKK